jgi:hypothetical protein
LAWLGLAWLSLAWFWISFNLIRFVVLVQKPYTWSNICHLSDFKARVELMKKAPGIKVSACGEQEIKKESNQETTKDSKRKQCLLTSCALLQAVPSNNACCVAEPLMSPAQ